MPREEAAAEVAHETRVGRVAIYQPPSAWCQIPRAWVGQRAWQVNVDTFVNRRNVQGFIMPRVNQSGLSIIDQHQCLPPYDKKTCQPIQRERKHWNDPKMGVSKQDRLAAAREVLVGVEIGSIVQTEANIAVNELQY